MEPKANPPASEIDKDQQELLKVVELFGTSGIHTYPGRDANNQRIFEGCVELEKKGILFRSIDRPNHVFFEVVRKTRFDFESAYKEAPWEEGASFIDAILVGGPFDKNLERIPILQTFYQIPMRDPITFRDFKEGRTNRIEPIRFATYAWNGRRQLGCRIYEFRGISNL